MLNKSRLINTMDETPIRQQLTLHKDFEWLSKQEITEMTAAFDGTLDK